MLYTVIINGITSSGRFVGFLPDPARRAFVSLPLVKLIVRLIPTIDDAGFAFFDDLVNKRPFTRLAFGEVHQ
jgi:hypothetical protein